MIQEIPCKYDPAYKKDKKPEMSDYLLHYEYNKVMLLKEKEGYRIPAFQDLLFEEDFREKGYYLFSIGDRGYYLVDDMKVPEFGGFVLNGMQIFREMEPGYQAFAGITGSQIYRWRESRRFCGCCGGKMEPGTTERSMVCSSCGHTEYPKICPAVIVAIRKGDKLLMSRYARGTYHRYALIAGYVEVGETFEECVRREVMEEVGLKVKNIRYYKSQPWSFSDSVMIGFTADLDGDDVIRLEEDELAEAGWFSRDEIVEYRPYISVGHEMMKAFKDGTLFEDQECSKN